MNEPAILQTWCWRHRRVRGPLVALVNDRGHDVLRAKAVDGGPALAVSDIDAKLLKHAPQLLHALRTILVALKPGQDVSSIDTVYLISIAIPRAQAVLRLVGP